MPDLRDHKKGTLGTPSSRIETLNRQEQGKHTPSLRTVEQLDRGFKAAEAQAAETRGRPAGAPTKPKPRAQPRRPRNGK